MKYQRQRLRRQIVQLDPKMKKSKMDEMQEESDLEDDWIEQHEKDLLVKEREKITTKFEKNNEKLVSEGQAALPEKELREKLKAVDEMEKELKREKQSGQIELKSNATVDKLLAQITKLDERIKATKNQALDKEEGKETALSTSKLNYIDPRISAVWCKKHNVPVEKVFSKTLRDKFQWAMEVDDDWVSWLQLIHYLYRTLTVPWCFYRNSNIEVISQSLDLVQNYIHTTFFFFWEKERIRF